MRGSGVRVPPPAPNKIKRLNILLKSLAIGIVVTLGLFGLGWVAAGAGAETLSYFLYWQAYVAQMLLPCTVVFRGEFLCQSEAAGMVAFYSGIPLGILIYAAFAYGWLRRRASPPA